MVTLRVRGRFGAGSLRRENAYGVVSVRPLQQRSATFGRGNARLHPADTNGLLSVLSVLRAADRTRRETGTPSRDQFQHYRDLLACFRSEQMSAQQLLAHAAEDSKFRAFLDENLT